MGEMSDDDWDRYFGGDYQPDEEESPSRRGRGRPKDPGHDIPGVTCIRETDAAILVRGPGLSSDPFGVQDPNEEAWFPKSQLHGRTEVKDVGDEGTLVITTWLAEKKGLL